MNKCLWFYGTEKGLQCFVLRGDLSSQNGSNWDLRASQHPEETAFEHYNKCFNIILSFQYYFVVKTSFELL